MVLFRFNVFLSFFPLLINAQQVSRTGVGSNPYIPFIYGPAPGRQSNGGAIGGSSGLKDPNLAPCFNKASDCVLVQAAPFERRVAYTPELCAQLCLDLKNSGSSRYQCRAFVFDRNRGMCDVFAIAGNQAPARLLHYQGYDYYQPLDTCTGTFVPSPITTNRPVTTVRPTTTRPPVFTTTTPRSTAAPATLPPPNGERYCQPGLAPVVQRVEGFELQGSDGFSVNGRVTEAECTLACLNNIEPKGTSYPCATTDFETQTGKCILSTEAAGPSRSGILIPKPGSVYTEKICVIEDVAEFCQGQMFRAPQTRLDVQEVELLPLGSYAECVEACLSSDQCFSGVWDDIESNCYILPEDETTAPESLRIEPNSLNEFFSYHGCTDTPLIKSLLSFYLTFFAFSF